MANNQFGRPDNKTKLKNFMQDSENTMMYQPEDFTGNKFLGTYSKLFNIQNNIFYEQNEKYLLKFNAQRKAQLELHTMPQCFDQCVKDVSIGLNSVEKNCMRDCYFKKISSRDDLYVYLTQRQSIESVKAMKERLV